ncbi:response regulator transcription factor [Streptomyces samsunensis]|uniref:Response regulator transcription factor n=3 Tax=Streptomyces TaxID=1883 RepID=A0ABX6W3I0_STRMQ|nr:MULTISPECIES: response regulator transcription factor [Streptomyces]MYU09299.1 response regulator [Streptomyces sp. SID8361]MYX55520.1 response regulator [Streptomyces sp. SID8382]AQA11535.1 DNA-binding response regulator [Streptomyces autolyticus]ATL82470.1 two component transcriptional regulator, LuxR family [Streptomyces malaysiensis]AUA14223.1 Transcriptional regulatory protein LiaR [Streptomyces sp. M56]
MPEPRIDVVIADDQELVRMGFSLILGVQPGITVVGEAADGVECIELARRLRPRVVLADIRMPRLDGLEVVRQLAGPGVADPLNVVVITTFDQDDYVRTALRNGACGFLLKDASPDLLVEAVQAAARGDALVSPAVTVRLLRRLEATERGTVQAPGASDAAGLSERERDIVRLVAVGRTNQEIGDELFLSLSTVKTYLGRIQAKLNARNRVEVAAWAWEHGAVRGSG